MKYFTAKCDSTAEKKFAADDMLLTVGLPTAAGSRMLEGYESLFAAEALTRLEKKGYGLIGKAAVGEFALDLVGETAYEGALTENDTLKNGAAEILRQGEAEAVLCLEVNGSVRRSTAQNDLVCLKPSYGVVSRYGTVPAVCSGEAVSVMAKTAAECKEIFSAICGHDDKDGTSLPQELCEKAVKGGDIKTVALLRSFKEGLEPTILSQLDAFCEALKKMGIVVEEIDDTVISLSRPVWNTLMSSEVCNNVSRYDGVKYGYRTKNYTNLDELYVGSRTEAFGDLLKAVILYGSDNLSTENYMPIYDRALRLRRQICEEFSSLFTRFDAVLLPTVSKEAYSAQEAKKNPYFVMEENRFTAPASVTGLPCVVVGGVQLLGKALSDGALLALAEQYEKEAK